MIERGIPSLLAARGIRVSFGGIAAISDLDLEIAQGEVMGLIGPNGAGKTTLINVLTGFQRPNGGTVSLDGTDVTRWPARRLARAGIARTFQNVRLFRRMSVIENLEVAASGQGLSLSQARRHGLEILGWLGLAEVAEHPCGGLPYGHERRVGIARALALRPRFVLLDEPAAGMNEAECEELMSTIRAIPQEFGAGVLLIEHNMEVVMGVCGRVQVIAFGRRIALGEPSAIRRDPAVVEAYLGTV